MSDTTDSTPLSSGEIKRTNETLRNTPISALPKGGFRAVKTVDDVIDNLDSVCAFLHFEMEQREKADDELSALKRDLAAAGRVLKLIQSNTATGPSATDAFKAIYAAMAIRHEFTTADLKQMARDHGVEL